MWSNGIVKEGRTEQHIVKIVRDGTQIRIETTVTAIQMSVTSAMGIHESLGVAIKEAINEIGRNADRRLAENKSRQA